MSIRARELGKLEYRNPRDALIALREVQREVAASDLPYEQKSLRARDLKSLLEIRQGLLFTYGLSLRDGVDLYFGHGETGDADAAIHWKDGDCAHFAPLQLKELPPEHVSPTASFQAIIEGLTKYTDAADLAVAVHLNRDGNVNFDELKIPDLKIASLWAFFAIAPDQSDWMLVGNLLDERQGFRFRYPEPEH